MSVSILIPTYNRHQFSKLVSYNINIQDYKDIQEIIVIDDGNDEGLNLELKDKIKINYIKLDKKISIGEKRNLLIKNANSKYGCFMDTDDIYYPNYISSSIKLLKTTKKKLCGSADMLFYFLDKQKTGYMSCLKLHLQHEATFVFETKTIKKWKFPHKSSGEGNEFLKGNEKFIIENDIYNIMVCLVHNSNTINKEGWYNEKFSNLDLKIDKHLELIYTLNI